MYVLIASIILTIELGLASIMTMLNDTYILSNIINPTFINCLFLNRTHFITLHSEIAKKIPKLKWSYHE